MFERIKSMFTRKESRTGKAVYMANAQAQWTPRNYASFADEGYSKNVVAYQAINKTADAVADIPLLLFDRAGNEITAHPLLNLLERPNPMQSGTQFMRSVVAYLRIAGNSYIERTVVNGRPRELYSPRPDRMKVVPGPVGPPKAYKYQVGNQAPVTWEVDQSSGESDIRHIKTFNPLNDWYGLSPIEAGAYGIDQHNEAMKWMQALLQNGAAPSGVLQVEDTLSDEDYNRMKAEIEEKYSGSGNAGRPILLEGGMSWQSMGFSPEQMHIIDQKYSAARDVSLALGVPPLLINIPGDSTYSNYHEARLAFYEETVIPLCRMIMDELNVWLVPAFGDGLELRADYDAIPAIQEKRRELWAMADRATDLTINEKRELKGFEPVTGGDTVYIPQGLIPLTFDLDEPTQSPEDAAREAFGDGNTDGQG